MDFVVVVAHTDLAYYLQPVFAQPFALHPVGFANVGVAFTGASGGVSLPWTVPNDPTLVDRGLWFQGVRAFTFPFELSPIVGGVIRP